LFETTTPGYVLREMFQKKQSSTAIVDDLHFNNKTSLDYSLKGRDRDSMIDLILTQTLIMQVQNRKLVEILIDNQDKSYEHVLKKARDWELLHKRTDNIQEQSGKTLNAYRAGNKNQAFQNQNQHGQNQQNRSNENFGNRRSRSESRNRGRGKESRSQSRPRNQNNTNQTSYRGRKCGRCGKDLHQKPEQCPAMKSKCETRAMPCYEVEM